MSNPAGALRDTFVLLPTPWPRPRHEPADSATVYLLHRPGRTAATADAGAVVREVTAGADGAYRIEGVPPGTYYVTTVERGEEYEVVVNAEGDTTIAVPPLPYVPPQRSARVEVRVVGGDTGRVDLRLCCVSTEPLM